MTHCHCDMSCLAWSLKNICASIAHILDTNLLGSLISSIIERVFNVKSKLVVNLKYKFHTWLRIWQKLISKPVDRGKLVDRIKLPVGNCYSVNHPLFESE